MVHWIILFFFTCNMYWNSSLLDENELQKEFTDGYQYQRGIDQYWTTVHQTVLDVDTDTVPFM